MSFLNLGKWFPDWFGNKAEKFEAWSVKVDTDNPRAKNSYNFVNKDNFNIYDYTANLKELASDYIEMIDIDGDNKISYDEFQKYNQDELKKYHPEISKEEIEALMPQLKNIYSKLNIDNDSNSKDNLDYREIMNYFYSMDTNNDNNMSADGKITKEEYLATSFILADNSNAGKKFSNYMTNNYKSFFKNFY